MIQTGLSSTILYIFKGLLTAISVFLLIYCFYFYKKKMKLKLTIALFLFFVFGAASVAGFTINFLSKEDVIKYEQLKKESFERGEQLIVSLELYKKRTGNYPDTLQTLLTVNPGLKFTDGWGNRYTYSSNGISFRLAFQSPQDNGYYFYNSVTGALREQGYLFKYMNPEIIR